MNSYPYASGAIKSLSNKILNKNKIYHLLSYDKDSMLKALVDLGYGTTYVNLEALIASEVLKTKKHIKINTPNEKYTNLFFLKGDIENINMLYKSKIFNLPCTEFNNSGIFESEELSNLILKGVPSVNKSLNDLISLINKNLDGLTDAKVISREIDNTVYKVAYDTSKKNNCLKTYYKLKIDTTNILTFFRMKRLNWDFETFKKLSLDNGLIDINIFKDAYDKDVLFLAKLLQDYYNHRLKQALVKFNETSDLTNLSVLLNQVLLDYMKQFENDIFDIGPVVYYLLTKEAEEKNIRMVYSSDNIELNQLLTY